MTSRKIIKNNSWLVQFAFLASVIFQISAYKYIWSIEPISRLVNILAILVFSFLAVLKLFKNKISIPVMYFYIVPGLFVYIGFLINISLNLIENKDIINQCGQLIPWAIYLTVPYLMRTSRFSAVDLWRYYNYFMITTVMLSLVEYFMIFGGYLSTHEIKTSGGIFQAGFFSILFETNTGELYYRLYAAFLEPGTFAMYLIPAIGYAFLHRKYITVGAYAIALYMTDSLGGMIGAVVLIPLIYYSTLRNKKFISIALPGLLFILIAIANSDYLIQRYEHKNMSGAGREENIVGIIENLPELFLKYPLGLPLFDNADDAKSIAGYYGKNFSPGNALYLGGILSFVGYITVLLVSVWYAIYTLWRENVSIEERCASISILCLFPFIFQREVMWDTSIFALLFAPYIISILQSHGKEKRTITKESRNPLKVIASRLE